MTQTFRPHNLLSPPDACAQCSHDDSEHLGECRTDVYVDRKWAKCRCPSFTPTGQ